MIRILVVLTLVILPLAGTYTFAQDGPVETVQKGCKTELESYCKNVTPGEGRLLACLYAYGDKLSSSCEYALYTASAQLEHFIQTVNYLANECEEDLKKFCSVVKPGEGRLLDCLEKNKANVSSSCKQAFQNIGSQ